MFIFFIALLSAAVGLLNLFPIPVLDGGHIVFSLWEGITRRKAHPKVVNLLVNVFAALLIAALILLSVRDIIRAPKMLRAFGILKSNEQEEPQPATNMTVEAPASGEE